MTQYFHSEDLEMNSMLGVPILTLSEEAVILDVIYDDRGLPEALVVMDENGIDMIYLGNVPMITMFADEEDAT